MRARTVPTAVLVFAFVASGCGGDDHRGEEGRTSTPALPAAATGSLTPMGPLGAGPRPLPATIVGLEVDAFPARAEQACADNTTLVEVGVGESIAAAVGAAAPGTTIRIAAGTYTEQPDEWLALQIDTDNLCLRAAGGEVVMQAADQALGIAITADDVVIEGLVLRGFETGIAIDGREGETQRALTIESTRIEGMRGEFREGVIVFAEPSNSQPVVDGLLLLDVTVDGADLGVSCNAGPCEHVWIEGTSIAGRGASGGSGADAFAIEEGRQIAIVNTVVGGATADGIDTKADDVVVFGCRVFGVGRNGIKLWRGGDVINTVVDGTGADAALVGEEPGTYRYLHTLVAHHDEGGSAYVGTWSYDVRSSDVVVEIVNSIFYDNASGGLFIPDGATLSLRNSILSGPADAKLLDRGDTSYLFADLAAFESAGLGAGNVLADPAFVDALGGDYSTAASSPARDAAEVIPGLTVDIIGAGRVQGEGPDIGPVEG